MRNCVHFSHSCGSLYDAIGNPDDAVVNGRMTGKYSNGKKCELHGRVLKMYSHGIGLERLRKAMNAISQDGRSHTDIFRIRVHNFTSTPIRSVASSNPEQYKCLVFHTLTEIEFINRL